MKLTYKILVRLASILSVVIAAWSVLFYFIIVDEINDGVDDALEEYSKSLICRKLMGEELSKSTDGSNNSYYIRSIADENVIKSRLEYSDTVVRLYFDDDKEPARILRTVFDDKNGNSYELTVYTPTIEKEDLKEAILQFTIVLYLIVIISTLLITYWIYRQSMKPLYVLLHWLDNAEVGNTEPLNNKTSISEFKKLNEAANRYNHRIQKSFEMQKEFIGNASHELQTPLAVCQSRLEMIADSDSIPEKDLGEIIKTQYTLANIIRLNKSLLLLSKIDNEQIHEIQSICLNNIVKCILPDYEEIYSAKNIKSYYEESSNFFVDMNEVLASTLVVNLIKNAFYHNLEKDGVVTISISETMLIVSNTGISEPLNKDKIFDRFYKDTKKEGSSGLGLAIVKSICNLYKLKIDYTFDGKHNFVLKTRSY